MAKLLGLCRIDSFDICKNSKKRKIGSACWTAGGALSLRFIAWHSLLHSAILDRLFLLPANSILCLWRRKKKILQGRSLAGGGSETGWGRAPELYSALVHQGPTLLQAACILSNRCSRSLPAEQRTEWRLATGHLLTMAGGWFWGSMQDIPFAL